MILYNWDMEIVWIVDDDPGIIRMVQEALVAFDYDIRTFETALDAVSALADPACLLPGVIVTDLMMPGMDGYTFHSELLKDERTRPIPLIVMTAKGKTQGLFEQSSNMKRFIEKPFGLDDIRSAVRDALEAP